MKKFVTAVVVFAAIVGILTYFGIKPRGDRMTSEVDKIAVSQVEQSGGTTVGKMEENISVVSHNQSGGVTAEKISIGRQPRRLTSSLMAQLDEQLPLDKSKVITIVAVMGDQEAFQFAYAIKKYLETQGRKVNGVNQAVFSVPVVGQQIMSDGTKITIGGME